MADDYVTRIERFLASHRISAYRFERSRKHRFVVVTFAGRTRKVHFPSSGSDVRGPANTVAGLRRALGIRG